MSVNLYPTWTIGDLTLTDHPYSVEFGGDHGAPETITELVESLLADGDLVSVSRHGNRELALVVLVEGPTLRDLAENEAALRRVSSRPTTLTFDPGDGLTPSSVFDVQTVEMRHARDDSHESHLLRRWELTLTCAPFARSAELVTVGALPSGSTTAVVDTCDTTTGWTGTRNGVAETATNIVEAGSVAVAELSSSVGFPPETWTLTRTGAVDFSTTPYLSVEMTTLSAKGGGPLVVEVYAGSSTSGQRLPTLSTRKLTDGSGHFRVVFDATGVGSVSALTFAHTSSAGYGHTWQGLLVREVARTNTAPSVTSRQLSRIVEVAGTERTPASLHVASLDGTTDLGMTIVHTSPEDGTGYSPPLRRWRVSGATTPTPDAATLSGAYEPIAVANPFIADVPNLAVPEGGYLLAARMRVAAPGTSIINWATDTQIDGTSEGYVTDYATVDFPNTAWFFVPIAALTLPSVRSMSGNVRVLLSSTTVEMDEAWLFRVDDDCALSVVHNAIRPHMWLDSPDLTSSVPRIWVGDSANRSDASHPGSNLLTHGNHTFAPSRVSVFTATSGTEYPEVNLSYYPRWHSNAAS